MQELRKVGIVLFYAILTGVTGRAASAQDCNTNGIDDPAEINPFGGYALDLDGSNDYVGCGAGSSLSLTSGFTIEAWVRTESTSGVRRIVSKGPGGGYGFGQNSGKLRFTTYGIKDYDTAGSYLTVGAWTHVAVVFDTLFDAHFYVNGFYVETVYGTSGASTNSLAFEIGRLSNESEVWNGQIDEVRVWNDVRTASELYEHYQDALLGDEQGLVAYWRLDEGSGAVAADSAGSNDGTLVNGPTWLPLSADCDSNSVPDECEADCDANGVPDVCDIASGTSNDCNTNAAPDVCESQPTGYAVDFDGIDDFIDVGYQPELDMTVGFTLEAWVRPGNLAGVSRIVSNRSDVNGYGFGRSDGALLFTTFSVQDYQTSASYLTAGEWAHVAVVMTNSFDAQFYVNGGLVESISGATFGNSSPEAFTIGKNPTLDPEAWIGVIDELRVWSIARSAQEILQDYDQPLTGDEPGLVGYWRLDDGSGVTAVDETANGNIGTLTSGPTWVSGQPLGSQDCNGNGVLDTCDIGAGTADDCNTNGLLDACEAGDCNTNAVPDSCEIGAFRFMDCNLNGVPDDCDLASGQLADCNTNGIGDSCELAGGFVFDMAGYAVDQEGSFVAAGDLNGDGAPDLASTNFDVPGAVSILLNDGAGGSSAPVDYATAQKPYTIAIADLDADGDNDIATASDFTVSVLFNDGDGLFSDAVTYSVDSSGGIAAADFDGDEVPDLAVANLFQQTVSILFNDGNGVFGAPVALFAGYGPFGIVAADLDGDLDQDLATGLTEETSIAILLNNGDGTFANPALYPAQAGGTTVAAADLDEDLDIDLAIANWSSPGFVSVLLNNGSAEFTTVDIGVDDWPAAVAAIDLDSDEDLDLAVTIDASPGRIALVENLGGTFEVAGSTIVGDYPQSIAFADFDDDGKDDLAAGSYQTPISAVTLLLDPRPASADCNTNDAPDECDLASGQSADCNTNGAADECDTALAETLDCNEDGVPDVCELAAGSAGDCNSNAVPDGCDIELFRFLDCDLSGVLDECELASGQATDCNTNAILDACELGSDFLFDITGYGLDRHGTWVAAGDLNDDGAPDLVSVNYDTPGLVSILLNDGSGMFAAPVEYAAGDEPYTLVIADLDDDGDSDIATANELYPDGSVSVLLNSGAGAFADAVDYPAGPGPSTITAADLDGDGFLDLAVANYASEGRVSVLFNNGDGVFAAPVEYEVGAVPFAIVTADLDGDMDQDLAIGNALQNEPAILLNNGDGSFSAAMPLPAQSGGNTIIAIDLDDDLDIDLAMTNWNSPGIVSVLLNSGSAAFTALDIPVDELPAAVGALDLDGDGDLDLAVAIDQESPGRIGFVENLGGGAFAYVGSMVGGDNPESIAVADFDNDGHDDLAVGDFQYPISTISMLVNARPAPPDCNFNSVPDECDLASGESGDCNTNAVPDECDVAPSLAFAPAVTYGFDAHVDALAAEDLDGDDDIDLVTSDDGGAGVLSVLLNNGTGGLGAPVEYAAEASYFVVIADLDGDQHPDLAAPSDSGDTDGLSILLNDGSGTFGPATFLVVPASSVNGIAAADFDEDGDVDLAVVAGTYPDDYVNILDNDGNAGFTLFVSYSVPTCSYEIAAADLNGDGMADLAIGSYCGASAISVLINDGTGTFNPAVTIPAAAGANSMAVGDLDGDADLDLVGANWGEPGMISVLFNDGAGGFTAVDRPIDAYPSAVRAADFDGDEDLDLAVTLESESGLVRLLLNRGSGEFADAGLLAVGEWPEAMIAADLDGDDKVDLATGNYGDDAGSVSILLNASLPSTSSDENGNSVPDECEDIVTGDMDCDGDVDADDVPLFIQALLDPAAFGGCDIDRADMNGDGEVDGLDAQPFVALLSTP